MVLPPKEQGNECKVEFILGSTAVHSESVQPGASVYDPQGIEGIAEGVRISWFTSSDLSGEAMAFPCTAENNMTFYGQLYVENAPNADIKANDREMLDSFLSQDLSFIFADASTSISEAIAAEPDIATAGIKEVVLEYEGIPIRMTISVYDELLSVAYEATIEKAQTASNLGGINSLEETFDNFYLITEDAFSRGFFSTRFVNGQRKTDAFRGSWLRGPSDGKAISPATDEEWVYAMVIDLSLFATGEQV